MTNFRYDVFLSIDKTGKRITERKRKYKYQDGLSHLNRYDSKKITAKSKSDDLAYVIYTSGTTGLPKGVLIHHLGMINHLYAKIHELSLSCDDIMAQTAPPVFDISVWQFLAPLLVGARTVIIDKEVILEPREFLKVLQYEKITILESVPSLIKTFLYIIGQEKRNELKYLRWMITTGEALPVSLVREWYTHYPCIKLVNAYGPTEASDDVTHYVVKANLAKKRTSVPIGKPLQNLHIYILDKNLALCPVGVRGEICIAGIGVGKGYWQDPDKTAAAFIKNPFIDEIMDDDYKTLYRTGDIGFFREDGTVECLGRLDNQVKIRGNRIELGEIENHLLSFNGIRETSVITVTDKKDTSSYLCAYVVPDNSQPDINTTDLREFLQGKLPDYMVPHHFIQLKEIPLTPNGKIDRKALPLPEMGKSQMEYIGPGDEKEKQLVKIWADILDIEPGAIGINTNFFELGGHSLRAVILVSHLKKVFNVKVPLAQVFSTPTIKGLSQCIRKLANHAFTSIVPFEEKDYYPLSSAQKRLYFLQQIEEGNTAYNMPLVYGLSGSEEKKKWGKAFNQLIQRHETLRTSFQLVDDEPVQKIHQHVEFRIEIYNDADYSKQVTFVRPFDLSRAPLIRVGSIKLAEQEHILMVDMHHIIADGVSQAILINDFLKLCGEEQIPDLKIRYRDYSLWQNQLIERGDESIKKQEDYWLKKFAGKMPVLNIPIDYPRPSTETFEGDSLPFETDKELTRKIREFAALTGTTIFMVLLAAYSILLSKYTGQEDIAVGTPVTGRTHVDLQNIIGMFVNMLVMRNYPRSDKTFGEFVQQVKENSLDAFENQDYQFDQLVAKLRNTNKDVGSSRSLVDAVLVLQNFEKRVPTNTNPGTANKIAGLAPEPFKIQNKISKFTLELSAIDTENRIRLNFDYRTTLFKKDTIKGMSDHLLNILNQALKEPNIKISDIYMLNEGEEDRLVKMIRQGDTGIPGHLINDTGGRQKNMKADFDF